MCLGRTFQLSRNIRQYRSFLQTDVKWLFLSILGLPEVWHVILHKNALFNISNFLSNGTILVNIRCCLSWEHILPSPFVAIGRRFSNAQNFYSFPFFKSDAMFPAHYFKKLTLGNNHFSETYPKGTILTENNSTKSADRNFHYLGIFLSHLLLQLNTYLWVKF